MWKTLVGVVMLVWVAAGCAGRGGQRDEGRRGEATVLWVSVDGVRGDYVTPETAPELAKLMGRGWWTRELVPVFPSLTFPSHASEATGVPVEGHGVPSNAFVDRRSGERYSFPSDGSLLLAEPIWLTAARQGVRVAVIDWPFSYQDTLPAGVVRTEYYSATYDTKLSDEARLGRLADVYAEDSAKRGDRPALRLLMGYVHDVDTAGHRFGPGSAEVRKAMRKTDELLHTIILRVAATFDVQAREGDELWVVVTTDHGMTGVSGAVNVEEQLTGVGDGVEWTTAGPIGLVYLDKVAEGDRRRVKEEVVRRMGVDGARAYTRETSPAEYRFTHPQRTGDVVVVLPVGKMFTSRPSATAGASLPKGMHGYPVRDEGEMCGFAVVARVRGPGERMAGGDLGRLDSLRVHPTVARLLQIEAAAGAKGRPLPVSPTGERVKSRG